MAGDDTEKKRKHDDILSDTEEDSDDEDLVNMDLKDYVSEEDPDYEVKHPIERQIKCFEIINLSVKFYIKNRYFMSCQSL